MVLFWNLELLVLLPADVVVLPDTIPLISVLVEVRGRFMVQLEMVLLLASFINCTPQPLVEAAARVIMKLSNFVKSVPLSVMAPLLVPVVDTMVLPLPLNVMALVVLVPEMIG